MHKKLVLTVFSIITGICMLLFIAGCKKNDDAAKQSTGIDTVSVQVARVMKGDVNVYSMYSGTVEGEEQANVVAKIPERITAIKVKVGDVVKAGALIATLDKSGAASQYYQAEAAFLNAGKDLDRMKALIKEGAISQQMLDGVQTSYNIAKANYESVKSTVELTAPISGIVTALNGRIGDNANPTMPLATIAQIGSLKAIFYPGETDISRLAVGQSVAISSDLKPGLVINGVVKQLSSSADIQSRTFEVKAQFSNTADRWFKPGMFCKVKAELQSRKQVLTVPLVSIITINNSQSVYTVTDGKAVLKQIQQGINDGINVEIVTGIQEGDNVITVGVSDVKNGSPIRIQK